MPNSPGIQSTPERDIGDVAWLLSIHDVLLRCRQSESAYVVEFKPSPRKKWVFLRGGADPAALLEASTTSQALGEAALAALKAKS